MEQIKLYFKSDFKVLLSASENWRVPFHIKFWTGSPSSCFCATFDGHEYKNCKLLDDGRLVVAFDDHKMGRGRLMMEVHLYLNDEDYKSGICDQVIAPQAVVCKVDDKDATIELGLTGDKTIEVECEIAPYFHSGAKVVNVADYITGGKKHGDSMPSDGDVYVFKYVTFRPDQWDEGEGTAINYIPNHRIVDNKLVFKVQQDRETTLGLAYYVFTTVSGTSWTLDEEFDGDDVPEWVKAAFGDDLHEKVANISNDIDELKKNGCKVVNIADYSFAGALMPSGADVYAHFDGGINYLAHYVSVLDPEGQLGALFCSIHSDGKGFIYTHFGLDIETGMYKFAGSYSSVVGDVPAWITKAFNEDLREKIGDVEQEVGQVKEGMPKVVDIAEYAQGDFHGKKTKMPLFASLYTCSGLSTLNYFVEHDNAFYTIFSTSLPGTITDKIYLAFRMVDEDDDEQYLVYDSMYSGNNVPEWIVKYFNDDLRPKVEKIGEVLHVDNNVVSLEKRNEDNSYSRVTLEKDNASFVVVDKYDTEKAWVTLSEDGSASIEGHNVSLLGYDSINLNTTDPNAPVKVKGKEIATKDDVTELGHEVGKVEKSAEELKAENAELKEDLAELEAVALVDCEVKYGQPRVLYGAGTPQEAIVPDNWVGMDKGGCYWNGQPLFVGQVYININATSNGRYTGVRNANYGDIVWKNF